MKHSVLITGCNGGIGRALVQVFSKADFHVIGVDCVESKNRESIDHFIHADIGEFGKKPDLLHNFCEEVRNAQVKIPLRVLINNAAIQRLGRTENLSADDFTASMDVNVIAPFLLTKTLFPELRANQGVVLNIGSVHAQATKPEFVAYATSKSALHGLTRALAVDLGPEVRVNTIAPAATATTMLKAGFEGRHEEFKALEEVHPLKRIAEPEEIAKIALFMASEDCSFLSGATIYADGGVLSRLHDPA